ncbi:hypothetical protein [Geoglobus acetivorans]|uniref:Uncharacterized protein n=1 Tax=Geoglobus acetivorans TaxID=565033 RepID=A0ABZ3H271_GEOAI|nr:hypothetical protein [Geoglobus acetivorans]
MVEELSFEDLKGQPKEFIIRGKRVRIPPLEVRDFNLFLRMSEQDPNKVAEVMKEIFLKTMQKIYPDKSREEILSLPASILLEFMVYILKANGLEVDEEVFQKVLQSLQSET